MTVKLLPMDRKEERAEKLGEYQEEHNLQEQILNAPLERGKAGGISNIQLDVSDSNPLDRFLTVPSRRLTLPRTRP